jgi:hypothetical protein
MFAWALLAPAEVYQEVETLQQMQIPQTRHLSRIAKDPKDLLPLGLQARSPTRMSHLLHATLKPCAPLGAFRAACCSTSFASVYSS